MNQFATYKKILIKIFFIFISIMQENKLLKIKKNNITQFNIHKKPVDDNARINVPDEKPSLSFHTELHTQTKTTIY